MSFSRRALIAAAIAVSLNGSLAAQSVQGVIIGEKSQAPMTGARVSLVNDRGQIASSTTSDSAAGTFYLDAPRAGKYQLKVLVGRGGLSFSSLFTLDSNQTVEHKFAVPDWPKAMLEAYLPEDVTKKAGYVPGNRSPRYPDALRARGRSGLVRAMVVVDTSGKALMNTLHVAESDDDAFTQALRDYLDGARFIPAERDGVKVPQVFDLAVDFGFGTEPARAGGNVIVVRAVEVRRLP